MPEREGGATAPVPEPGSYGALAAALEAVGLRARGGFHPAAGEAISAASGAPAATLVLAGAVGDSHWAAFARAPERRDGGPDPLDRWSRRVLAGLADAWGARALFPFGGPPHWPFQRWAARAEPLHPSPLGLLIHARYGLWHSYRGALAFERRLEGVPVPERAPSPCDGCAGRPCLSGCPVDAFAAPAYDGGASPGPFDAGRCGAHLATPAGAACLPAACLARAACPVGAGYRYGPAAARFHLGAFAASLAETSGTERTE